MTPRREPEPEIVAWFCTRCLAAGQIEVKVTDTCLEVSHALDEAHAQVCELCERPHIIVGQRSPYPD